jgi:hypothetical protein
MALQAEELLAIAQVTDLVHTIIEDLATLNIYINWRNSNGTNLDRRRDRADVVSHKTFELICQLRYQSPEYWNYVHTVVNFIRSLQNEIAVNGISTSHAQVIGATPTHFTEDALVYVYNQMN